MEPELKRIFAGTLDVSAIIDPIIKCLVNKLHSTGCRIENQTGGVIFRFPEHWVMYYSKASGVIQTYYLGYGHCAQICPLQDFRNSDHIILWQEKNKSIELTERPNDIDPEYHSVQASTAKNRKWLTQDQIQEIIRLVKEGYTKAEVSRMFDVSNQTVFYYCKRFL